MSIVASKCFDNKTLFALIFFYPIANAFMSIAFGDAGALFSLILAIYVFVKDRSYLRSMKAFVPAWGWFFIPPVYVYKRQNRNGLNLKYFWYFLALDIVLFVVAVLLGAAMGHAGYY